MKKVVSIVAMTLVVVMALGLFAACGYPDDPDKAKEQLEKDGYTVVVTKSNSDDSDVVAVVTATKSNIGDYTLSDLLDPDKLQDLTLEGVAITYYRTADLAKENVDKAKESLSKKEQEVAKVSRQGSKVVVTYKLTGEDANI